MLVRTAHERFEDVEALRVIADRLCELGERRGELMALQLARGNDAVERIPRPLEVLHCRLGSISTITLAAAFPKLRTLGFEAVTHPPPVLERILALRPAQLSTLWLPAQHFEPLAVQRALSNAPGLTVNLFYGGLDFGGNAAWVAVTSGELALHERRRHAGGPDLLGSARELMLACGVHSPTVHHESSR